jgi:hypothetical protein
MRLRFDFSSVSTVEPTKMWMSVDENHIYIKDIEKKILDSNICHLSEGKNIVLEMDGFRLPSSEKIMAILNNDDIIK